MEGEINGVRKSTQSLQLLVWDQTTVVKHQMFIVYHGYTKDNFPPGAYE